MNPELLERYMQIAQDTKKDFSYHKSEGMWFWHDRDEPTEEHGPFPSFWDTLCDVVAPYIEEE